MSKLSVKEIVTTLEEFSLLELNELIEAIKEKFNVSMDFSMSSSSDSANGSSDSVESTEKDIYLTSGGSNKIAVIKIVREISGVGLMDAKKLVDEGGLIKSQVASVDAESIKQKLIEAGATVELK